MSPSTPSISEIQMTPGLLRIPQGLGENVPGELLPIGPFLRMMADRLDEANVSWAVLRNAEGLPDYTRYDVDLLLKPESLPDVIEMVKACALETGWHLAGTIRKRHYTCLMLMYGSGESGFFFLPLDFFTGLEYRGLQILETEEVLASRVQLPSGIWTVAPGMDAAITLLKEWLPHGVLKENSRDSVHSQVAADPEGFQRALVSVVGDSFAAVLLQRVQKSEWRISPYESRRLRQELRSRTPGVGWAVLHAAGSALVHLFRPSLGLMVCLAGADGSGKTTLAQGLVAQTVKHPFKAIRYSHGNIGVLPRFRDIRAFFRGAPKTPEKTEEEGALLKGMMTPIPAWKSMVLAAYYALDLNLARFRLRRWRGQWSLILMDRSFYDYFIQLGHRNCPKGILRFLSALIPKPDLLLCLTGNANQIHARKPELTVEEIEREQVLLREMVEQFSFARLLDGEAGIAHMVEEACGQMCSTQFGENINTGSPGSSRVCCWTVRNRPVMAYAAGTVKDRLRAIDLFPRSSFKRRLLAFGVRHAVSRGSKWRFSSVRDSIDPLLPPEDLKLLLDEIKKAVGATEVNWLVTWPARPERKRIYLIVRAPEGGGIHVVKIGAGEFNRRQLRNEAAVLQSLAGSSHPFAIPSVLVERALTGGRTALVLGGFPDSWRPLSAGLAESRGAEMIAHLKGLPVPVSSMRLKECDWFSAFCDQAPAGIASRRLLESMDDPVEVGFAHGDLGPGNMLKDDANRTWLFDWENASVQAPILTDPAGLWLAMRQREVLRGPANMRSAFRAQWGSVPEPTLLAALAFLCAHGNLAATRLLEGWE